MDELCTTILHYHLLPELKLREILQKACLIFEPSQPSDPCRFESLRACQEEIVGGTCFIQNCTKPEMSELQIKEKVQLRQNKIKEYLHDSLSQELGINKKLMSAIFKIRKVTILDAPAQHHVSQTRNLTEDVVTKTEIYSTKLEAKDTPKGPSISAASHPPKAFIVEFKPIDKTMLDDFFTNFDDSHNRVERKLLLMENAASESVNLADFEEDLRKIFRELHSLKGTARFTSLILVEKIIHVGEDLLDFIQKFITKITHSEFRQTMSCLIDILDISSKLRDVLLEQKSEEPFWENLSNQESYLATYQRVSNLKTALESRGYSLKAQDMESIF